MARSGSVDFTVNSGEIIELAMSDIGVLGAGQTASADDYEICRKALNILVKQLMVPSNPLVPGLKVWQRGRSSLTLAAKSSYAIKLSGGDLALSPPIRIISAVLRDSTNATYPTDVPLRYMTLEEQQAIASKSALGTPARWFYEREYDQGTLYLDIIPVSTIRTTHTIPFVYLRDLQDLDTSADNLDFPSQWLRALEFNLALDIAPKFDRPVSKEVATLAAQSMGIAQFAEPDEVVAYFEPNRLD